MSVKSEKITNSSSKQNLVGIQFENNLRFDGHVSHTCKKALEKLSALSRVATCIDINLSASVDVSQQKVE